MKVIAAFVDQRNGKRYSAGDGAQIDPPLEPKQIERLKKAGCLEDGNENGAEEAKEKDSDGLEAMTVADLKALAELHKVELGDAKNKADIVAVLRAADVKAIG